MVPQHVMQPSIAMLANSWTWTYMYHCSNLPYEALTP